MVSALISRIIMLVFGTLFPAYRSYKAIKTKNVREYVKWMMYWIIFALFITSETFADIFLSWLPLYYEIKVIFIIWLLSPATKGSSILYRKFVHPRLVKHEKAIDKYIAEAQKNGYAALMHVGRKGLNVASETIVKTAATSQTHLIRTLKRYNSMQDLIGTDSDAVDAGLARQRQQTWHEGMAGSATFDPDEDVDVLQKQYKAYRPQNFIREDSQAESMYDDDERHDSDPGISGETNERRDFPSNYGTQEAPPPADAYASHTLPRMRKTKERKSVQGAFPDMRTTRSGRSSGARETRDSKTNSVAF